MTAELHALELHGRVGVDEEGRTTAVRVFATSAPAGIDEGITKLALGAGPIVWQLGQLVSKYFGVFFMVLTLDSWASAP